MSTNGYAKIERGERRLDIPKLGQIAQVFGIDAVELMQFDDKQTVLLVHKNRLNKKSKSVICHINHDNTYYNSSEQLTHEIETLKLTLTHKDELLHRKNRRTRCLKNCWLL